MILRRAQHFTDVQLAGERVRRRIANWSNYRLKSGLWLSTDHAIEATPGVPDDWEGPDFNFARHISRGPLQMYFGDTSDPDNTTMVGVRFSDKPNRWLQAQAQGVTPGVQMQVVAEEKQARWVNLWPKSSLVYQAMPNGLRKYIHIRKGHPPSFRFAVRVPAGATIRPADGGAEILDDQGQLHLRIPPPWGMDSSNGDPLDGDGMSIRVELEWGASFSERSGNHVQMFRIVPNPDDLAAAVYPVLLDPTVQITGAPDIENNTLDAVLPDNNHGGWDKLRIGKYDEYRLVTRIAAGSIPAGTITAFRYIAYYGIVNAGGGDVTAYIVADANDWVEGTAGHPGWGQPGSSNWNHAKRSTQTWAGSVGCGTSGTDYDADGSPPTLAINSAGWKTHVLDAAWPPLWRDAARAPNGVRFDMNSPGSVAYVESDSLERARPPYFEIDYTVAAGDIPSRFLFMGGS